MRKIIEYNWGDEKHDFEYFSEGDQRLVPEPDHIFRDLVKVKGWLQLFCKS